MLSIVVPVYNEEGALPGFLAMIDAAAPDCELVFADGGSVDATLSLLAGRTVVQGAKGRGAQIRVGVARAAGDELLVLHADARIDRAGICAVRRALRAGAPWGCLTLRFDDGALVYRAGAWVSNMRVALWGIAFGDQAMFFRRSVLEAVGGVPDLPLMEDYELSRRLRAQVGRPCRLKEPVLTSARRFQQGGPYRQAFLMRRLRRDYRAGVPIEDLAARYADVRKGRP
ncbi:TIGR04283 family arsenosugar biosynthesis glycosyltransferase [Hugonella massiliensis]|uniref:TIGR04283 family arsenosugar biosynthesis glycosyltransferase n=1 Tax=Hugonella massiliensis TaxID=1720315 RepID=UPI00073F74FE|nr:TIGR04283 family arsenosugar biosynthesis glycosyltransferase [Hugonella massiliensis]